MLNNLPDRVRRHACCAWSLFPLGPPFRQPRDALVSARRTGAVALGAARERLTRRHLHLPNEPTNPLAAAGRCAGENAFAAKRSLNKLRTGSDAGRRSLPPGDPETSLVDAISAGMIDEHEAAQVRAAIAARKSVIGVDEFPPEYWNGGAVTHGSQPKPASAGRPVYVVDGSRTPVSQGARRDPGPFRPSDLAVAAGRAAACPAAIRSRRVRRGDSRLRHARPDEANIARVVALRLGCGERVPAWTVQRNCASGMQALDAAPATSPTAAPTWCWPAARKSMSHAPMLFSEAMVATGWRAWNARAHAGGRAQGSGADCARPT